MATALARSKIEASARLRHLVRTGIATIWHDLPTVSDATMDEWLGRVLPLITAAKRHSALLTDAYLARALEGRPVGLDMAEILGPALRNGADPATVYARPFATVWTSLGNGATPAAAYAAGLARAQGTGAMDVQLAMRGAAQQVQARTGNIYGYMRVADGDACEFCQAVDGAYLKEADSMPLHNDCGCDIEPIASIHPRATHLPDGTRVRSYSGGPLISTPPPPTVAVHQHGELGPMLAAPGDHFAGPAAANT